MTPTNHPTPESEREIQMKLDQLRRDAEAAGDKKRAKLLWHVGCVLSHGRNTTYPSRDVSQDIRNIMRDLAVEAFIAPADAIFSRRMGVEPVAATDPDAWMREDGSAATVNPMIAGGWKGHGITVVPLYSSPPAQSADARTVEALIEFFKWSMRTGPWDGGDIDGASVQDRAQELGLIVKTQYDAEKHGIQCDFEHGDDWFEYSPMLNLASAKDPS